MSGDLPTHSRTVSYPGSRSGYVLLAPLQPGAEPKVIRAIVRRTKETLFAA